MVDTDGKKHTNIYRHRDRERLTVQDRDVWKE